MHVSQFPCRLWVPLLAVLVFAGTAFAQQQSSEFPRILHRGAAEDAGAGIHAMDGLAYWRLDVVGPRGKWRVVTVNGTSAEKVKACCGGVNPLAGTTPGSFRLPVSQFEGRTSELRVEVEFISERPYVDEQGVRVPAGKPVILGFDWFDPVIIWTYRWWAWEPAAVEDPKKEMPPLDEFAKGSPLNTWVWDRLDSIWVGSPRRNVPADHYLTQVEGVLKVTPGEYEIAVTASDGVRLWVDDRLVIDQWRSQPIASHRARLRLDGERRLRVEHFKVEGQAVLKFDIRRIRRLP